MSESRPTLSELGAQIPPGIQNLIMFLEETLIKGRIAPLEAKLTLLERKVDGYTSEIVEKAIDSAIRSAYNTISDESVYDGEERGRKRREGGAESILHGDGGH